MTDNRPSGFFGGPGAFEPWSPWPPVKKPAAKPARKAGRLASNPLIAALRAFGSAS